MDLSKEYHDSLHSFCIRPGVSFDSQMPGEEVILVLRAHPITQLPWILNSFVLLALLIGLNFVLPFVLLPNQIAFANIFGAVLLFSYVWFNFLSWFFNVGIVTNQRIVDIDYTSVLYKQFTAARLGKIEQVTSRAGGYFSSIFDYGNVFVETASEEIDIEFTAIPHPTRVVEVIDSLVPAVKE